MAVNVCWDKQTVKLEITVYKVLNMYIIIKYKYVDYNFEQK